VAQAAGGDVDYKRFDVPTVMRKKPAREKEPVADVDMDSEYLDIPAFLRRQAD
jgi:cell division protein FtsZ